MSKSILAFAIVAVCLAVAQVNMKNERRTTNIPVLVLPSKCSMRITKISRDNSSICLFNFIRLKLLVERMGIIPKTQSSIIITAIMVITLPQPTGFHPLQSILRQSSRQMMYQLTHVSEHTQEMLNLHTLAIWLRKDMQQRTSHRMAKYINTIAKTNKCSLHSQFA